MRKGLPGQGGLVAETGSPSEAIPVAAPWVHACAGGRFTCRAMQSRHLGPGWSQPIFWAEGLTASFCARGGWACVYSRGCIQTTWLAHVAGATLVNDKRCAQEPWAGDALISRDLGSRRGTKTMGKYEIISETAGMTPDQHFTNLAL